MTKTQTIRSSALLAAALFGLCGLAGAVQAAPVAYDVEVIGPGGHSNGNYGHTNAVHAAARIAMILEKTVPTATITGITGGVSVNAIAGEAKMRIWAEPEDAEKVKAAVAEGCAAENAFRGAKAGDITKGGAPAEIRYTISKK